MVLFTSWLRSQIPSLLEQMQAEAEDDHCPSEDDFDEDEATQYIIEQSLIQYRKLKRLSPRSEKKNPKANAIVWSYKLF